MASFPLEVTPLWPLIALAAGSLVVLVIDLMLSPKRARVWCAAATFAALAWSLGAIILQWPTAATVDAEIWGGAWMADRLTLLFGGVAVVSGMGALLLSMRRHDDEIGGYFALILLAALGMSVLAGAGNLIVLFIGIEMLSLSLYVAVALRGDSEAAREGALKYFVLGSVAAGFLLYGSALLYGATGTLQLSELGAAGVRGNVGLLRAGVALVLVGLGFKMALAPFHTWAPDAYQGAPTPITALMSVGTKVAAFGALIRLIGALTPAVDLSVLLVPLWVMAILSMVVGSLGALRQVDVKRLLAYSGVAHAGYLLVALSALNESSVQAGAYYALVYLFMTLGAFAIVSLIDNDEDDGSHIERFEGLLYRRPLLAGALLLFLLSLAGMPPAAGFIGKLRILFEGVSAGANALVATLVVTTGISAFAYLRVVFAVFRRQSADKHGGALTGTAEAAATAETTFTGEGPAGWVVLAAAAGTLYLGLYPNPIFELLQQVVPW